MGEFWKGFWDNWFWVAVVASIMGGGLVEGLQLIIPTRGKRLAEALREVEWAFETLPPSGQRELSPRSLAVRRAQHCLARELGLESTSVGERRSRERRVIVSRVKVVSADLAHH